MTLDGHPEAELCFTVYPTPLLFSYAGKVGVGVSRLTSCPCKNNDSVIIILVNLFTIPLTGDLCFGHYLLVLLMGSARFILGCGMAGVELLCGIHRKLCVPTVPLEDNSSGVLIPLPSNIGPEGIRVYFAREVGLLSTLSTPTHSVRDMNIFKYSK